MDLSIIIPARNEMFLKRTIEDILAHIEGDTDIIAVLDGYWPDPPIEDNPRVILIHHSESIGQRAACNEAVRVARGKYIMKVDAHCAFDQGFDVKMISVMQDDLTMIPVMRNLHVFNWVCETGHERYQGPSGPCKECGKPTKMRIIWNPKTNPQSTAYYFDKDLHFQYWNHWGKRQTGDLTETMSAQGSCFMITKKRYLELNICDESWGSWGNQGTEVALKTWLSGGRLVVNRKTWYAHCFRTQGGDFGFPYELSGREVEHARQCSRDIFLNNKWDKAIHPLSWLIDKFKPPTWEIKSMSKGIIYYTDNRHDPVILSAAQRQIKSCCDGMPIVSVSLQPIEFGRNIVFQGERGVLTQAKQILIALENSTSDIIFFCESDVLYHPSHFNFTPPRKDVFYYNDNKWKVDYNTGQALFYHCAQVSGLCAYRDLLLEHYRKRIARIEKEGVYDHKIGYEPGAHQFPRGIDEYTYEMWNSEFPNIDIRHNRTMTANRWSQDQFRDKNTCLGWQMSDEVPFWGKTKDNFQNILKEINCKL
jgi:glycosyltransferase involved in cell wall biosynthesis